MENEFIDIPNVNQLLDELLPSQNKTASEDPSSILRFLKYLGVERISQVRGILERYKLDLIIEDQIELNRFLKSKSNLSNEDKDKAKKEQGYRNRCELLEKALVKEFGIRAQIYLNSQNPSNFFTVTNPFGSLEDSFFDRPGLEFDQPECVYKYLDGQTALAVLGTNRLRLRTPLYYDDLFDVQIPPRFDFDESQLMEKLLDDSHRVAVGLQKPRNVSDLFLSMGSAIRKEKKGNYTKEELSLKYGETHSYIVDEAFKQLKNAQETWFYLVRYMRVLCMSEKPNLARMWAEYAARSHGIVLGFGTTKNLDPLFRNMQPISYSNVPPVSTNLNEWINNHSGEEKIIPRKMFSPLVFSKSLSWKDQLEWRSAILRRDWIVNALKDKQVEELYDDIEFDRSSLTVVVFGARTCPQLRQQVKDIVVSNYPNVSFKTCSTCIDSYELIVKDTSV